MSDQRGGEFAFVVVAAVLLLLVLIGGGLAFLLWQRTAMTQRVAEMARLEAEQQRALAERQLAEKSDAVIVDADSTSGKTPTSTKEIAAIEGVLLAQQAAWNDGDIDAFMETYWKSDDLTFSSSGSTTRSWQSTLVRYKNKYPTREAMGMLSFSDLQVQLLAPDAAYVLGRWDLKDKAGGNFTLIMKKLSSAWVIVHDHSSLDAGSAPEKANRNDAGSSD